MRDQFCHAIDLMPTILDAAGIEPPATVDGVEQMPIEGRSLLGAFASATAPAPRTSQYFEMLGSRAIYHDGWKATTDHVGGQLAVERENIEGSRVFDEDNWLLFDLAHDFSESRDLAAEQPERVQELIDVWWAEAERNHVLPLDDSFIGRAGAMFRPAVRPAVPHGVQAGRRSRVRGRVAAARCRLRGDRRVSRSASAPKGSCSRSATGPTAARGTCSTARSCTCSTGSATCTASSRPNPFPRARTICRTRTRAKAAAAPGSSRSTVARSGRGELPHDLPFRWQIGSAGLTIGADRGFPVCDDYTVPFRFTGTLHDVTFAIPMLAPKDDTAARAELGIALKGE